MLLVTIKCILDPRDPSTKKKGMSVFLMDSSSALLEIYLPRCFRFAGFVGVPESLGIIGCLLYTSPSPRDS